MVNSQRFFQCTNALYNTMGYLSTTDLRSLHENTDERFNFLNNENRPVLFKFRNTEAHSLAQLLVIRIGRSNQAVKLTYELE